MQRATVIVLSIILTAFSGATSSAQTSGPARMPDDFFPYGAMHMATISHWQHYLPPIEEWAAYMEKDIANMAKVGFNAMAVHVDWFDIEIAPGEYNFARLDRVMDMAEKHGLKMLLWPWPELQPEWVAQKYPESRWLAADDYRPGPGCWDHPEVRAMTERFVRTVVNRYKNRPSLLAWDVGAEAGIWVSTMGPVDQPASARLYCYCDHTVKRYREWLQRKYGTIGKLNEVWATYYRDFSQVQPVRMGVFERAQIHWLDWRDFMLWNTDEFQRTKADAARQADPAHPITAHMGSWGGAYVHHAADEYRIARHFDVFSLSFFPFWLERGYGAYDPSIGSMLLDGIRSASGGKPMWVEELQGGPCVFGMEYRSRFPTPEDIRLWTWQSIAHGTTGIFYWNWRPETTGIEAGGFGLVNYDGSLTDRAKVAGQVAQDLQKHAKLLLGCKPVPAEVAILHDPRAVLMAHGDANAGVYASSMRGVYRAFWRANIPVDFVVPEQLMSFDLRRYKAIYLPFVYLLSQEEGRRLADYVDQGGSLFAGLWCGLKDERTFVYETVPGAGLSDVLHCKQIQVNPAAKAMKLIMTHPTVPLLETGSELPVYRFQDQVELLDGAQVLASFDDGTPAIIAGRHGRGSTMYVGTLLAQAYDQAPTENAKKLLIGFAAAAGVQPPLRIRTEPPEAQLELRVLQNASGQQIVIVMNHGSGQAKAILSPRRDVSDLLSGEQIPADGATVSLELPARSVRVLLLK